MVEIRLAAQILHLVIIDGKKYIEAVDEVFANERKTFGSVNISVVLAKNAIKHYFLYENILHEFSVNLTNKQKCLLYIILTNNFYLHILSNNNCVSFIQKEIPEEEFKKLSPILKRKESLEDLISFEKSSDFYYATKYNVPIWLIHMWRKHFGDELVTEFLEASIHYDSQSYMVNTLKTTTDEIIKKYPDLTSPFEDMLIYNGTKRYQTTPEFKKDDYFDVKIGFKSLIDTVYNQFYETLIYSGYDDDFVKAAIVKSDRKQSLNVAVPNLENRAELLRFIRVNDIHNVNLFEAKDIYGLKAGVSYKQDVVIVFPKSTRFDIASKYPDFLLHFDRDSLDEIIKGEKESLELYSSYVNDGGTLIYLVNTLNKKESFNLVKEFLDNHPEFELIKEEQLIASHPFGTTMYYAVLNHRGENND